MLLDVHFYCLNFENLERKKNMQRRFNHLGLLEYCTFYDGVSFQDKRIDPSDINKKATSCSYGHLDMIKNFYYNSNFSFGIFCEDDIFLRKDLKEKLPSILSDMHSMELDTLLLGYLAGGTEIESSHFYSPLPCDNPDFKYYTYPFHTWGTQMYILSRNHAKHFLDKYTEECIRHLKTNPDTPFAADFIFTKEGKKNALIRPIMAIEDNLSFESIAHSGQQNFHRECFQKDYKPDIFEE